MLRRHRIEILLVAVIVLVAAAGMRVAYQPVDPEEQFERVESQYDLELGEARPLFSAWTLGDGQAYALIAADVSGNKLAEHVQETTYRYARAGYGWLSSALSLGRETLIPYGLALAGALSVLGVVGLAIHQRGRIGPRAWWLVLNPALYYGFAGDTSEPLAILLLGVGLAWGSWVTAALLGVTRPTFLIAAWGNWRLFLPGVASAALLALYSLFAFGPESFVPHGGRLGLPLAAYLEHPSLSGAILVAAAVATIVAGVRARDWSWLLAGVFVLCFGDDVLRDPVNAWRAAGFLPVMWAFGIGYARERLSPETASSAVA